MKTFADRIVPFFASLKIDAPLPDGISVMNPYREPGVNPILEAYFRKFYDDTAVRPFIKTTLIRQHAICGHPTDCICLGEGENLRFMRDLNQELGLFKRIHPLAHPRFIMQYRRKYLKEFVGLYLDTFLNFHC